MPATTQREADEYARKFIKFKAGQLAGRYGFTQSDTGDIEQDLTVDLLERLSKFDPTKAKFSTFVARIVEHKISRLVRDSQAQKRDYRREERSLNDLVNDGDGRTVQLAETISHVEDQSCPGRIRQTDSARLDAGVDVRRVLAGLPPDLREAAERLKTHSIAEIAREQGIARSTFYEGTVARLRRIFANAGLRDYL